MNVVIAGAHGQIALRLARLLAAKGDRVTGLIRNPDHAAEVSRAVRRLISSRVKSIEKTPQRKPSPAGARGHVAGRYDTIADRVIS